MFFSSSKSAAVSSLIAFCLVTPSIAARSLLDLDQVSCLRTNQQIVDRTSCGDKGSIDYCFGKLQPAAGTALTRQLESCLVNAGCSEGEADVEAGLALAQCDLDTLRDTVDADLRRRQAAKASETETQTTANKPTTTAKSGPKTTLVAATTEPAAETTTEKPTTAATTTTTSPSTETTTAPDTSVSTPPPATTTAAPALGLGLAHSGRPPVCFTTSLSSVTSCPVQSTGSLSGHAMSCFPTTIPTAVCAAGLICNLDANGSPSCMYAYTKFDTAGIAIAIFFAVAVTGAIGLIVTMCCRERRVQRRLARAMEAADIAHEAQFAKYGAPGRKTPPGITVAQVNERGAEKDWQPLMEGEGTYAGGTQEGPFGDQNRVR